VIIIPTIYALYKPHVKFPVDGDHDMSHISLRRDNPSSKQKHDKIDTNKLEVKVELRKKC